MLSKQGLGSRSQAATWVREGRVKVNGRVVRDPEFPVRQGLDNVELDTAPAVDAERIYLMLNKPRGLVTSARDEQGRDTVYRCFEGSDLPWLAPVGRLDKASEGLLLFCNDPAWAAAVCNPALGPDKTYHVQIDCLPSDEQLAQMRTGIDDGGERLAVSQVRVLRQGQKQAWLEIVLDEGRNRQIRRLLAALGIGVQRLLRVAVGPLALGDLAKGQWRRLTRIEVDALRAPATPPPAPG